MSDWNEYQAALQKTDELTREKIRSSLISDCVAAAVTKHGLDASHTKILVQIYVDVLLKLITPEAAVALIRSAAIPSAAEVHAEIWEHIQTNQPKFTDFSQQITTQYQDIASANLASESAESLVVTSEIPVPEANGSSNSLLESEIAETEAALNAIPKIRTMVQDAQESTTHTSSQSELLNTQNRWNTKPQ
jgi:hypothetical protein